MQAASTATGSGLFKKLGRVLREKAAGDLERIFKGTSKTREKLGVKLAPERPLLTFTLESQLQRPYAALSAHEVVWAQRALQ